MVLRKVVILQSLKTITLKYLEIMTNLQVIKANGFSTKRLETSNYKGIFGGTCNHVVALLNSNNEVLHYEGKPYFPCGRNQAFASLIKSGDITANCFTFKSIKL